MFDFIRKLFFTYKLMKSHSLHENKHYEEAIEVLNSLGTSYDKIKNLLPDYYLLLGILKYEIGDLKNSYQNFIKTKNIIPKADSLNYDEQVYLTLFVHRWLIYLTTLDKKLEKPDIDEDFAGRAASINYYNVSKSIKNYFPLEHASMFESGTKVPVRYT